jgi:hypothetical protein
VGDLKFCPKCSSAAIELVSPPDSARKFQCRRLQCLEIFLVSRPHYAKTPSEVVAERIEEMARANGVDLKDEPLTKVEAAMAMCAKGCGKEFKHEAWRLRHEGHCDGVQKINTPRPRKPKEHMERTMTATAKASMDMVEIIDMLKAKRQARVDELISDDTDIKALDLAIENLENRPSNL